MAKIAGRSFEGFRLLSEEMSLLFDNVFRLHRPLFMSSKGIWHPPTDVFETEKEYVVIMDVAGIRPEDVYLSYESGLLTIRGVRREFDSCEKRHYHIMEIDFGPFERRIKLPRNVNKDKVKATYKDGFLEIRLEKSPERRRKTVTIEVE
ncbi:MAG: Hsp20/alpha crystallin family protein [bacterium]